MYIPYRAALPLVVFVPSNSVIAIASDVESWNSIINGDGLFRHYLLTRLG